MLDLGLTDLRAFNSYISMSRCLFLPFVHGVFGGVLLGVGLTLLKSIHARGPYGNSTSLESEASDSDDEEALDRLSKGGSREIQGQKSRGTSRNLGAGCIGEEFSPLALP